MKALAIDSSATSIIFHVKNDDKSAKLSLDIGMHQSEQMLPSIQRVLEYVDLTPDELEFCTLCQGPGSFTGLRLSYSALKAFTLSFNTPIYAIPTLEAAALPFHFFPGAVVSVLDAKKHRYYAAVYRNGKENMAPIDAELEEILKNLDPEERILAVGTGADLFADCVRTAAPQYNVVTYAPLNADCTDQLLYLAQKKFAAKEKPLEEYEGPVYIRPSEAEEKLNNQ